MNQKNLLNSHKKVFWPAFVCGQHPKTSWNTQHTSDGHLQVNTCLCEIPWIVDVVEVDVGVAVDVVAGAEDDLKFFSRLFQV